MSTKKFDYTESRQDIFYTIIYPLYAKEFMFGEFNQFVELVKERFILNPIQWEYISEHWEQKESLAVFN
jgi:hypothetical protein